MAKATEYSESLALWRTYPALRDARYGSPSTASLLATLSDAALAVASANPDHSEAGRKAAHAALLARGVPQPPPRLVAPGFLSPADADRAVPGGLRGREYWLKWIGGALCLPLAVYFFAVAAPASDVERERALTAAYRAGVLSDAEYARRDQERPDQSYETYGARDIMRGDIAPYACGYRRAMNYGASVLILAFLSACVWCGAMLFRSEPARILLLRKFNNRDVDDHLRRFVARNLVPLGHVFVLADKYYRRPRLTLTQLILGYPIIIRTLRNGYYSPSFWASKLVLVPWDAVRGRLNRSSAGGRIRISNAGHYRRFGARVPDRLACNAQMMATPRRSVMVQTSDDWWQHTIILLMRSADMIVVDLSDVTQGTEWELDRLVELDLLDRSVFIVREDAAGGLAITREYLNALLRTGRWGPKIRAEEARRAIRRMGLGSDVAAIRYDNRGRALAPEPMHQWMRAALRSGTEENRRGQNRQDSSA